MSGDAGLRVLERAVRETPNDGRLREQLRVMRKRLFGYDKEDPIFIGQDKRISTTSMFFSPILDLDISNQLAIRPPQPWRVEFAASISKGRGGERAIVNDAVPIDVQVGIFVDEGPIQAGFSIVRFEPDQSSHGWRSIQASCLTTDAPRSVEARWFTSRGTAIMGARHLTMTPLRPE